MKKSLFGLVLALALIAASAGANAAEEAKNFDTLANPAGNPVDQFTGQYWVNSKDTEKGAYLYGIDSAITVEYYINSKMAAKSAKAGKKPVYSMSPFEKGWMKAFTGVTRKELIAEVNNWYADHPDRLDRPVLDVIWHESVAPRLEANKGK